MTLSSEVLTIVALAFGAIAALLLIHILQFSNPPRTKEPPTLAE